MTKPSINMREVMATRYTTKAYDGATKLTEAQIAELAEVLRLAPSSINAQPWHFTIVSASDILAQLAEVSFMNAEKIKACSHLVVLRTYRDQADFEATRVADLPPYAQTYYHNNIAARGEAYASAWRERQVYIALGVLLTAAAQLGIDSTPMEGIDTAAYDAILADGRYTTLVAVALGKRAADDQNQPQLTPKKRREANEVVRYL